MEWVQPDDFVPDEVKELAESAIGQMIPAVSKQVYDRVYEAFKAWKQKMRVPANNNSETVVSGYMKQLSETVAPNSLYSHFSMLKKTMAVYENVDKSKYYTVFAFMKQKNVGYVPKSEVLRPQHIKKFIAEAPDLEWLVTKVKKKKKKKQQKTNKKN